MRRPPGRRVRVHKLGEHRRQMNRAEGDRRGDAKQSGQLLLAAPRVEQRAVQLVEGRPGAQAQRFACLRQHDTSGIAGQQSSDDLPLNRAILRVTTDFEVATRWAARLTPPASAAAKKHFTSS